MKILDHLFRPLLLLVVVCLPWASQAQDDKGPDVNYLTQTTTRINVPDGMKEDDMWDMMEEYYQKVLSKSKLLVHYTVYRHAWGSQGATLVMNLEFKTWDDIMKFNRGERQELEKAAWPDETARKAFLDKMDAFWDTHHKDEIYVVSNTMRK
ncbi:MAG: hypothetical protein H6597_07210 [Flavobacteriales bacterium]|nr:hypothetical protein [Flavobacteriales bacterium]MCB9194307.1 hypothetical protein [Flavobacteriales bacterium]